MCKSTVLLALIAFMTPCHASKIKDNPVEDYFDVILKTSEGENIKSYAKIADYPSGRISFTLNLEDCDQKVFISTSKNESKTIKYTTEVFKDWTYYSDKYDSTRSSNIIVGKVQRIDKLPITAITVLKKNSKIPQATYELQNTGQ